MHTLADSCTLALSKGGTDTPQSRMPASIEKFIKASCLSGTDTVQASMNGIPQGNPLSRERFCMLMV